MRRPKREAYARVEVPWVDLGRTIFIELGVEMRAGEEWLDLVTGLRQLVEGWVDGEQHTVGVVRVAEEIEVLLRLAHPDRAYFIEVWPDCGEGWVQIFQPYGIPRDPVG